MVETRLAQRLDIENRAPPEFSIRVFRAHLAERGRTALVPPMWIPLRPLGATDRYRQVWLLSQGCLPDALLNGSSLTVQRGDPLLGKSAKLTS
jgi:hypothetical protein